MGGCERERERERGVVVGVFTINTVLRNTIRCHTQPYPTLNAHPVPATSRPLNKQVRDPKERQMRGPNNRSLLGRLPFDSVIIASPYVGLKSDTKTHTNTIHHDSKSPHISCIYIPYFHSLYIAQRAWAVPSTHPCKCVFYPRTIYHIGKRFVAFSKSSNSKDKISHANKKKAIKGDDVFFRNYSKIPRKKRSKGPSYPSCCKRVCPLGWIARQ